MNVVRISNYKKTISELPLLMILKRLKNDQLIIEDGEDLIVITRYNYLRLPLVNRIVDPLYLMNFQCFNTLIQNTPIYSLISHKDDTVHIFCKDDSFMLLNLFNSKLIKNEQRDKLNDLYDLAKRKISEREELEKILIETKNYFLSDLNEICSIAEKYLKDIYKNDENKVKYSLTFTSSDYNKFLIINDSVNHKIDKIFIHNSFSIMYGNIDLKPVVS
jgi:hypothetical protein